ncbi:hypothetical protein PGT21_033791 [Puccinia graminis f. sp. tritici]|uniref:Uncharacterized protein n=1 Tax=Puccinia graminis f. sp. tritici TaxID=56615 RepID=A0A5B0MGT9_PUCGR|nr:hypothetical protein PGT21_033791 [Puccinia graminis f. sp. tritici]
MVCIISSTKDSRASGMKDLIGSQNLRATRTSLHTGPWPESKVPVDLVTRAGSTDEPSGRQNTLLQPWAPLRNTPLLGDQNGFTRLIDDPVN